MSWFKKKQKVLRVESERVTNSSYIVTIGVRHYQVRLTGGIPDGEAFMTINKFGECTAQSTIFKMDNVKMFGWYLREAPDGSSAIDIQIAGQIFSVLPQGVEKAKAFFLENLIEFKDKNYPNV
jgi:hypothetical protein